jgi:hypothetical protein
MEPFWGSGNTTAAMLAEKAADMIRAGARTN